MQNLELFDAQRPSEIEISLENGSEAPGFNEKWSPDISRHLHRRAKHVPHSHGDITLDRNHWGLRMAVPEETTILAE